MIFYKKGLGMETITNGSNDFASIITWLDGQSGRMDHECRQSYRELWSRDDIRPSASKRNVTKSAQKGDTLS